MNIAAPQSMGGNATEGVFNTLRVVSPDGEEYIPSSFIMTAAREMGYYPTSQYLHMCLADVLGNERRLTFPLFVQLCSLLEETKTLDDETIDQCRRAFDINNSGVLNRSQFRTILTSSSAADITSSEVEAIIELLDPIHTDAIQLSTVQLVLMHYISRNTGPRDESLFYTPRSARQEAAKTVALGTDGLHGHPSVLELVKAERRSFLDDSRTGVSVEGKNKEMNGSLEMPSKNNESKHRPSAGRSSTLQKKAGSSPVPTTPEEALDEETSCMRPQGATAPSDSVSGPVTRATSLQQSIPGSEQPSQWLGGTPAAPSRDTNQPHSQIEDVEKSSVRGSRLLLASSLVAHTLVPPTADSERPRGEEQDEYALSVVRRSHFFDSSTRRGVREPLLEDLREVTMDDLSAANDVSDDPNLQDAGHAAVPAWNAKAPGSTHGSTTAIHEIVSRESGYKRKSKIWTRNCCLQS